MKVKGTPGSLSPRELRQYYNRRFSERPLRAREGFYSWIARKVPPAEGSTVLDIACGGGYLLQKLQPNNCNLFGCDIATEALRIAQREAPEAQFAVADAEKLPYQDSSFDMVYNLGSLEHFLDMETAACEMRRVLRPQGSAVVMVPNSRYIGDMWRKLTLRGGADHHQLLERFGSLGEWRELLESNGFKVREVFAYNKFKKRLSLFGLKLAYCFVFVCHSI